MDEFNRVDRYIYTTINLMNHLMFVSITLFNKILFKITFHLFPKGLTFSSFGPTYVDFKYLTNTDMSWVGLFPSVAAVACIIGSVCE